MLLMGGGVGLAAIGSSIAFMAQALHNISLWSVIGVLLCVMLIFGGPVVVVSLVKLYRRNVAGFLEAGGWALNKRMRLSRKMGLIFTSQPRIPVTTLLNPVDVVGGFLKQEKRSKDCGRNVRLCQNPYCFSCFDSWCRGRFWNLVLFSSEYFDSILEIEQSLLRCPRCRQKHDGLENSAWNCFYESYGIVFLFSVVFRIKNQIIFRICLDFLFRSGILNAFSEIRDAPIAQSVEQMTLNHWVQAFESLWAHHFYFHINPCY